MKTKEIKEGQIDLKIPDPEKYESPEEAPVFYNPKMKMDRTLSIEALKKFFPDKKPKVLDGLSATGIRALRYSEETNAECIANDADPKAVKLIQENKKLNNSDIETSNRDANQAMLSGEKFDYIDIDPFGSPAPFLNNVFKGATKRIALVGITATDLGALSGSYPKTCFRRYGTTCKRNPFEHEIGIRNLIYAFYKAGAVNEFTVDPLLCYWKSHYYRCFFEVKRSKTGINRNMDNVGYVNFCESCGKRRKTKLLKDLDKECSCGEEMTSLGPTWLGYLGDDEFLDKLDLYEPFLRKIRRELKIKEPYYNTHWMSSVTDSDLKKKEEYIQELENQGYKATETTFTGHGFKTNAPQEKVIELFRK